MFSVRQPQNQELPWHNGALNINNAKPIVSHTSAHGPTWSASPIAAAKPIISHILAHGLRSSASTIVAKSIISHILAHGSKSQAFCKSDKAVASRQRPNHVINVCYAWVSKAIRQQQNHAARVRTTQLLKARAHARTHTGARVHAREGRRTRQCARAHARVIAAFALFARMQACARPRAAPCKSGSAVASCACARVRICAGQPPRACFCKNRVLVR